MRKSLNTVKVLKGNENENNDSNLRRGTGQFSFSNEDTYDGDYKLHLTKTTLVKDGQGVYITNDFNMYSGKWENDNFADDHFLIRHNNGARYEGGINTLAHMSGKGVYTFPDDSSIHATWSENKPVSNITYQEPLGYIWMVESISDDSISFVPSNHFWTELCQATMDDVSTPLSLSNLSIETVSDE
ncbi:hypothetical protein KPH14_006718 [Odynerus spinipes]|uniref:Uncharacterized protein n=1 Tax=Odynerus spinipes TaxID=1348599 RepID=A0AAD9VSD6_9HYME|nr:hypothetical protein KPH14_006718 [Odynerus spinipes]